MKPEKYEFGEDDGQVLLAQGDSLELAFTPVLQWRDALLRVFGLAMPRAMFCAIRVDKIAIMDGTPHTLLKVHMSDGSRIQNIETPCDKAPSGWTCTLARGHEGPCVGRPSSDILQHALWCASAQSEDPSDCDCTSYR